MPATADLAEEMNAVLSKDDAVAAQEVPLLDLKHFLVPGVWSKNAWMYLV